MKKLAVLILAVAAFTASTSFAGPSFPDKGWHKGFWVAATGGMMQATDDRNVASNVKFGGSIVPALGLSLGYDITDWIGIMLQFTYGGLVTANVGDGTATYPVENAREHIINLDLMCRYTFLTGWSGQPDKVRILPYVKAGGAGRGLFVNASTDANKVGAYGFGGAVGAGIEFLVIDRIFFALDATEHLMFMQSQYKTVNGTRTEIIAGGFKPNFQVLGMVGYHF